MQTLKMSPNAGSPACECGHSSGGNNNRYLSAAFRCRGHDAQLLVAADIVRQRILQPVMQMNCSRSLIPTAKQRGNGSFVADLPDLEEVTDWVNFAGTTVNPVIWWHKATQDFGR